MDIHATSLYKSIPFIEYSLIEAEGKEKERKKWKWKADISPEERMLKKAKREAEVAQAQALGQPVPQADKRAAKGGNGMLSVAQCSQMNEAQLAQVPFGMIPPEFALPLIRGIFDEPAVQPQQVQMQQKQQGPWRVGNVQLTQRDALNVYLR